MAKSGKERSAKAAKKRIELDAKELQHRCRLGTRKEALRSHHEIAITENVAQKVYSAGER